ncbi:YfjI family protein [Halothiobacillus sp.]|uniref:YfjI family protein n=1 Tax=Halothiobacillus sp. TaxID=1891311 RepID=UPI002612F506|nr:YfjI family protein [Halothiobacillus sp.]
MASLYDQAEYEAFATATFATPATHWDDPVPLVLKSESTPYPIDVLPDTLRHAVIEVQSFTQAPLAMVATAAITAMAACVQAHFDVERAPSLHGPTSLYGLILADSGERKTTVEDVFNRPIAAHDAHHRIRGENARKSFEDESAMWESEKSVRARTFSNAKSPEEKANALDFLKDHMESEPKLPRTPKIVATDITPEQLAFSLANMWPCKHLSTSEGGVIFGGHGMKSDNILKNLAVLNTAWGGKVEGVDRRTSESYPASDGVRCSASIMVQPSVIQSFLEKSGTLARGSGFLARFLVCWPESTQGYRPFKYAPASWPNLNQMHAVMTGLLDREPAMDEEGHLTPEMLRFSDDGRRTWISVHDQIEIELRRGGDLHELRDSASKAADNVARLAAVFHCAEKRSGDIESDHVEAAAIIVSWHLDEAKRLFNELAVPLGVLHAKTLIDWLTKECRSTGSRRITTRKISQYAPNQLRAKAARDAALELLEDANHLRIDGEGKTRFVELNPSLLGVSS